jgi:asparagine synthetase B (glutamine-hydrolysing)
MGNSLEVRVPFLDAALVDGVLALPESAKRVPGAPKSLLIAALGDLLPPEILGQRKKTFTFPWERWLRGSLGHRVAAGLADWSSALAPVLSQQFALSVWDNFKRGRTTWSRPWSLYVLNQWAKQHLAAAGPSASDRARRTQTVNASH